MFDTDFDQIKEASPGAFDSRIHERYFGFFTNSRTREKWQVSQFQMRDFVHSRTTFNKYGGIHEFTNKFFNFHEKRMRGVARVGWGSEYFKTSIFGTFEESKRLYDMVQCNAIQ